LGSGIHLSALGALCGERTGKHFTTEDTEDTEEFI